MAQAMQAFLRKAGKGAGEKHGKQSLKSLTKSGASIENVELPPESDINSFKSVARKYHIDFTLHKDKSTDPPSWIIFFKAKDSKSMDLAFKEFAGDKLKDMGGPSTTAELERFKAVARAQTKDVVPDPVTKPKDMEVGI